MAAEKFLTRIAAGFVFSCLCCGNRRICAQVPVGPWSDYCILMPCHKSEVEPKKVFFPVWAFPFYGVLLRERKSFGGVARICPLIAWTKYSIKPLFTHIKKYLFSAEKFFDNIFFTSFDYF
jgi:hypothetical protein